MRALWVLLAVAACGDNVLVDPVTDAVSGTRIKVQRYRYDDGTEQTEPFEYYDTLVHTTCRAVTWADGIVRCGPVADAALYTDAACTTVVGRADTIEHPSHFVGSDVIDGVAVPTRVYTAGAEATAPASYFERQDGACAGPFPTPPEASYFEATEERSGDALQPLRDGELGAARLAVRTVETDDGLRVPVGFHDRSLVADCAPESRADGSVWCAPTDALAATRFADASCSAPVVVADTRPAFASISDAAGCASYAAVGEPVTAPLFRLDGDACVPAGVASGFAVGSPVELAPLERSLAPGGRRLSQIVLDTGDLQLHADELFDTATRADCRRQVLASETEKSDIVRCIPRTTDAQLLYTNGCVVGVLVAELPQRTCGSVGFATAPSETGLDVHAIGDPMGDALFEPAPFGCRPHVVPADATLHALGPALPPEAFVGAIYFGDR